ncbi:hypothetical protein H206_03722 [Candidatus Electrothrix aarhusensis]|uniref:Uncharacterized protein n=1 Tax=Candidatus Electrothrix aarhusensis TaxID=1859131 RepID=A0A3S3U7R3_9BACT|nr:hypothetical protein H206_03722 [Candidatus Electrothrix aarhusensis]
MDKVTTVNSKLLSDNSSQTAEAKISCKAIFSTVEQKTKCFIFIWGSHNQHNEPYRPTDGWYTLFQGRADHELYTSFIAFNTGFVSYSKKSPDLPKPKSNYLTRDQSRQIGLNFRKLSDLLVRYRHRNWTNLNDNEQYYIENIEWSLINYCTDCANAGISLYSKDATSLYYRITDKIEKVCKHIRSAVDSRQEDTAQITKLGAWALKFGAAISSNNHDQLSSLVNSHDASPEHNASTSMADPAVARSIGFNFSRVSDLMLRFHYLNWEHLDSSQRSTLQNIESILLNYNSNFGGLGITLGKGQTKEIMEQVLVKSRNFITAISQVAENTIDSYNRIIELGNRVLNLGAALTGEDVQAIRNILKEEINFDDYNYPNPEGYNLSRKMGLEFRNMASLLLKYRYNNGDTLTKKEKYQLENLEFTLTNFNSNFAVFGLDIDPGHDGKLIARVDTAIKRITALLENEALAYETFFAAGMEGVKLGSAIFTENKAVIKKAAALSTAGAKQFGNTSSDALARGVALRMRITADTLLKQRYENWNCFTQKEGEILGNIEWTLMNFASNFFVLGIDLDSHERRKILESATRKLDSQINTLGTLKPCAPADKSSLFTLGMNALKTGATLTTEGIPAIKAVIGDYE